MCILLVKVKEIPTQALLTTWEQWGKSGWDYFGRDFAFRHSRSFDVSFDTAAPLYMLDEYLQELAVYNTWVRCSSNELQLPELVLDHAFRKDGLKPTRRRLPQQFQATLGELLCRGTKLVVQTVDHIRDCSANTLGNRPRADPRDLDNAIVSCRRFEGVVTESGLAERLTFCLGPDRELAGDERGSKLPRVGPDLPTGSRGEQRYQPLTADIRVAARQQDQAAHRFTASACQQRLELAASSAREHPGRVTCQHGYAFSRQELLQ